MNSCYATGSLSASQRSGLITLLCKRGDCLDMKNWCPITLLCVDYTIASKAIANRLLLVLQDIITHINQRGRGGAVLSLDQEKAFDRVDWSYLQCILVHMHFGLSFCSWVSLFYSQISSSVLINGMRLDSFFVSRGVRQGCPLSPLLYIILAETLANVIRVDSLIDGFFLPGNRCVKVLQYADDTSIIVMSNGALVRVFEIFRRYELASGAKLNVTKSNELLVGSWVSRTNLPVALQWSSEAITVMGAQLSNGTSVLSWHSPLEKLDGVLSYWKGHQLSFHGRAFLANSLGLT